ncbi:TPA: hypothetical protein ACPZRY_004163 [Yersinia enterocolitica]|nr:hypothetical protein [Yersinia enterocolitica]EKN4811103.1 hypothetical protein [Yersinia enterocolitica]EKN4877951.1 hypothetical protein [Yersinia enterocolitica]ELI7993907.1 hypothetical protein [Yersinia enterocolitica]HDL7329701.1 hypothetical protein [Yersinia enterocolitica]
MTQDERFYAALESVAWTRLIADPRFTDEMAQMEANADQRTSQQQQRIQEVRDDRCL